MRRKESLRLPTWRPCRAEEGYPSEAVTFDWARRVFPEAFAYFIEHRDGFLTTLFMLSIQDFNYAGINGDSGAITSCQMFLPMPGSSATTADFFNPLVHQIERMVLENRESFRTEFIGEFVTCDRPVSILGRLQGADEAQPSPHGGPWSPTV